ncbi:hypothetical protein OIU77_027143 [Salix suchowensis]|uniref:Transmembrane protein n=1 Tax=Salix suchowensis TaxID=1278906 RepID=A0ABQ9BNJ7_9ROSI|nr:hypothetical protein OIU77_027143 [Salix suchowensis]
MVRAAVRVVLPWSTWPIVPMLTWGFFLSNFPLAARTVRVRWRVVVRGEVEEVVVKRGRKEDERMDFEGSLEVGIRERVGVEVLAVVVEWWG